ncbi:MAG: hypothetical protein ACOX8E_01830 [Ruminococcus sp.]|jgi:hypothetical protein
MKDLYTEIELQISRIVDYLTAAANADNQKKLGELHAQILQAVNARMELLYASCEPADHIRASSVTLQVTDEETGRCYSRLLPLDFKENNNGLVLSGESADGKPSEIVFFSNTAAEKISDVIGHGPDHSHCKK